MVKTSLTDDERERIMEDILSWKYELEFDNTDFDTDIQNPEHVGELEDTMTGYLLSLVQTEDDELITWWWSTVGEWVESRFNEPRWAEEYTEEELEEPNTVLENEFSKLRKGEETTYGFIHGGRYSLTKETFEEFRNY